MQNIKFLAPLTVILLHSLWTPSYGGMIKVINQNKKPIKIRIQAEGNSLQENLSKFDHEVKAEDSSVFQVERSQLGNKSHYFIEGDIHPLAIGNKCEHLSAESNYKITFTHDTTGTTCVAEMLE